MKVVAINGSPKVKGNTYQALEAMALVIVIYATINLMIALVANLANRWLMRQQGR